MWKESDYFKTLELSDQEHYKKKLTLTNGDILPDPFALTINWSDNVTLLPDVDWPDIYQYLINTPSEFTHENLKAYKSLEAYNFFVCGHVQDVFHHPIAVNSNFCYIKSSVLPSQRQGKRQECYQVWVAVNKSGWVLTANCTCMAGLGSACSHVGALLFKLQACVQLQLNKVACTSKLCAWKQARQQAHPAPLNEISFKRPKKSDCIPTVITNTFDEANLIGFSSPDPGKSCTEFHRTKLTQLKAIAPNAAVFNSISLWSTDKNTDSSDTDTADETELNSLPEPITYLYDPSLINDTKETLFIKSKLIYKNYLKTCHPHLFENLCKITSTQSLNETWKLHRIGRITASNSKLAYKANTEKPSLSFIKTIMKYNSDFKVPATIYGTEKEQTARDTYFTTVQSKHENFILTETGLHVNSEFPCLGASPDGLVTCDCHGPGLLEIKCPYKYKNGLKDWYSDKNCPIKSDGTINEDHQYYYQMQHQMLVTNKRYCDFYVWSQGTDSADKVLTRVEKNDSFCKALLEKLIYVFEQIILPEVITRKNDPKNENKEQLFCYCRKPSFLPMIACDNSKCEIEWFHYSCVNIVRAPTKSWYCPTCRSTSTET